MFGLELVTVIATIMLAVYAGIQVRLLRSELLESKISRDAGVVLYVLEHMDEIRDQWHALYDLPDDYKIWNDEERKLADHVCAKLQQIAYLSMTEIFDRRFLLDNYAGTFVKCWGKLEGFVKNYRIRCGEPESIENGAFQRRHLELFVYEAKKYMKKFSDKASCP